MFAPILTPHGRLLLDETEDSNSPLSPDLAKRLHEAFARGHGHGLLQLGAAEVQTAMPAVFAYWREFASRYVVAIRTLPDLDGSRRLPPIAPPPSADLAAIVFAAPAMKGAEYLSTSVLELLWADLDAALRLELSESESERIPHGISSDASTSISLRIAKTPSCRSRFWRRTRIAYL